MQVLPRTMLTLVFAVVGVVAFAMTARAQTRYTIIDLGVLDGYVSSCATALNDRGEVVGYSDNVDGYDFFCGTGRRSCAFLYRDGRSIRLGTPPGETNSDAVGINDRGEILCSFG